MFKCEAGTYLLIQKNSSSRNNFPIEPPNATSKAALSVK